MEGGAGTPMTNDFTEPTCPGCHADLLDAARWKRMSIEGERGEEREFLVLYCRNCARFLSTVAT